MTPALVEALEALAAEGFPRSSPLACHAVKPCGSWRSPRQHAADPPPRLRDPNRGPATTRDSRRASKNSSPTVSPPGPAVKRTRRAIAGHSIWNGRIGRPRGPRQTQPLKAMRALHKTVPARRTAVAGCRFPAMRHVPNPGALDVSRRSVLARRCSRDIATLDAWMIRASMPRALASAPTRNHPGRPRRQLQYVRSCVLLSPPPHTSCPPALPTRSG
jgi:hypothetical protein